MSGVGGHESDRSEVRYEYNDVTSTVPCRVHACLHVWDQQTRFPPFRQLSVVLQAKLVDEATENR